MAAAADFDDPSKFPELLVGLRRRLQLAEPVPPRDVVLQRRQQSTERERRLFPCHVQGLFLLRPEIAKPSTVRDVPQLVSKFDESASHSLAEIVETIQAHDRSPRSKG